jgi:subtilase family serine protease
MSKLGIRWHPQQPIQLVKVPPINAGLGRSFTFKKVRPKARAYRFKAWADFRADVTECNEFNNSKYITFVVKQVRPDLIILFIHKKAQTPDRRITVEAHVKNRGDGRAPASRVLFRFSGEIQVPLMNLPPIAAGSTRILIRHKKFKKPGPYKVTVTADINHKITEWNETNNTRSLKFTIN